MHTTMKKKYIQPEVLTIKLCACAVIASSPDKIDIHDEGGSGTDLTKDHGSWGNLWGSDDEE